MYNRGGKEDTDMAVSKLVSKSVKGGKKKVTREGVVGDARKGV